MKRLKTKQSESEKNRSVSSSAHQPVRQTLRPLTGQYLNALLSENLIKTASYVQSWSSLVAFSQANKQLNAVLSSRSITPAVSRILWEPSLRQRWPGLLSDHFFETSPHLAHQVFQRFHLIYKRAIRKGVPLGNPRIIQTSMQILRADKAFMLAKHRPLEHPYDALRYASSFLRADSAVVLEALSARVSAGTDRNKKVLTGEYFRYAGYNLKDSQSFMIEAMRISPYTIQHASDRLKNDDEWMRSVIEKYPLALQYASAVLKDDRALVFSVLHKKGELFQHISDRLKDDEELAYIAPPVNART